MNRSGSENIDLLTKIIMCNYHQNQCGYQRQLGEGAWAPNKILDAHPGHIGRKDMECIKEALPRMNQLDLQRKVISR